MNPLSPNLMTTRERLNEICAILARGVVRLRIRKAQVSAQQENFGLHFSPDQSGGPNPDGDLT